MTRVRLAIEITVAAIALAGVIVAVITAMAAWKEANAAGEALRADQEARLAANAVFIVTGNDLAPDDRLRSDIDAEYGSLPEDRQFGEGVPGVAQNYSTEPIYNVKAHLYELSNYDRDEDFLGTAYFELIPPCGQAVALWPPPPQRWARYKVVVHFRDAQNVLWERSGAGPPSRVTGLVPGDKNAGVGGAVKKAAIPRCG